MRYAIYFTPQPGSLLHKLGSEWLGRDVFGDEVPNALPNIEQHIVDARRYGLHATLKAPFHLREGMTVEGLLAHVATLSHKLQAVNISQLVLSTDHGFLSLRPSEQDQHLGELERHCVCGLDSFRAEPAPQEIARRNVNTLTPRQRQHLADWGYPYVLDAFRFHITLSCQLDAMAQAELHKFAVAHFAPVLGKGLTIDNLTVFQQQAPDENFSVLESFRLARMQVAVA